MAAKFIVKRRSFESKAPGTYMYNQRIRYHKWQTVHRAETFKAAEEWQHEHGRVGLYDWGIFYRGKRLTKGSRRILWAMRDVGLINLDARGRIAK